MNLHVRNLTPTQETAINRSLSFRASIAAKAAELAARKMRAELDALRVVTLEAPLARSPIVEKIEPEAMPAETDPPSPNWFLVLASDPIPRNFPSIREIQQAICDHFGVGLGDLMSSRRTADICRPRQIAYYLCKELTPRSLPEIARRFGGRDHTTVLYGVRKIGHLCPRDADLAHEISFLIEAITGKQQ